MSQEIIRIETINTDVINVATTEVIKIEGVGLQGNSGDNVGVLSFNGRIGIVSPELDDYQASLITNNSTETGATVKDALDALDIEQGTQDTAIALNTAKRSYPLADENRLAGTSGTNTGDQDLSGIEDAITAIEDTAVFESPISPNPVNYIWLGTDIDYQAIIAPQDDTIYNINNNLETKAFYFKTQNVSPITPTITGTVADWKSVGSDEGTDLGVSNPTFTYSDSSIEHLVTATDFDPLNCRTLKIQSAVYGVLDVSSLQEIVSLDLRFNAGLTEIIGMEQLSNITNFIFVNSCKLTGFLQLPVVFTGNALSFNSNPLLTGLSSLSSFISSFNVSTSVFSSFASSFKLSPEVLSFISSKPR